MSNKQIFGWNATKKATALPKAKPRSNQITANVIRMCNMQGCNVSRNNTLGVFDVLKAVDSIWKLIQQRQVTTKEIKRTLQSCYRTTGDRKGTSDIIGMTGTGQFLAIEVKGKGDKLDKDGGYSQENYLREVGQKGGLAFVVAEEPEKVKLRIMGSDKYIIVCNEVDFLQLLIQKLKQPYT